MKLARCPLFALCSSRADPLQWLPFPAVAWVRVCPSAPRALSSRPLATCPLLQGLQCGSVASWVKPAQAPSGQPFTCLVGAAHHGSPLQVCARMTRTVRGSQDVPENAAGGTLSEQCDLTAGNVDSASIRVSGSKTIVQCPVCRITARLFYPSVVFEENWQSRDYSDLLSVTREIFE